MILHLSQFLFGDHLMATLIGLAIMLGIALGLLLGYFAGRQHGFWAGRNKQIDVEAAAWRRHRENAHTK